jgi:uncharacterized protein
MKTLKTFWMTAVTLVAWTFAAATVQGAEAPKGKVNVLVVTGGHSFEKEPFFQMFKDNSAITFQAVEHPQAFAAFQPAALAPFDVIVLYDMQQNIPEAAKADLVRALEQGKGLVALHHCLCSYQTWGEYERMIGGKYLLEKRVEKGIEQPASTYLHDVKFTVRVADPQHPVTRGLKDFAIVDETYGKVIVSPDMKVLLTTEEPTSGKSVGWTHAYGKSRVVYLALGHDHQAYQNPNYRRLLARAIQWTAGRTP